MQLFIIYGRGRTSIEVEDSQSVSQIKEEVRNVLGVSSVEEPGACDSLEKRVLTLHHAGADLRDHWILTDIGITSGSTIKVLLRDEVKPSLYLYCGYDGCTLPLVDWDVQPGVPVAALRAMAVRTTGLPVGVFKLLTRHGVEMHDCNTLHMYGVQIGDTVTIETWNENWNYFLNYVINGYTPHVMQHISQQKNENLAKYEMHVALYMAAHYGHMDLAVTLVRMGAKANEPTGEHPARLWCKEANEHIDRLRCPVHVAAEMGQIGVLRAFVHHDISNVLAQDGNDLTPLNISLRRRQKACASFLLTKQWSKMSFSTRHSLPLSIYVKMRRWAERSKDKVLLIHGQWKSSVRNHFKRHVTSGALVGNGVIVDGYPVDRVPARYSTSSKSAEEQHRLRKKRAHEFLVGYLREQSGGMDPEKYFKSLSDKTKFPHLKKTKSISSNLGRHKSEEEAAKLKRRTTGLVSKEYLASGSKKGTGSKPLYSQDVDCSTSSDESGTDADKVTLPPIKEGQSETSDLDNVLNEELTPDSLPEELAIHDLKNVSKSASVKEVLHGSDDKEVPMKEDGFKDKSPSLEDDHVYIQTGQKDKERILRRERVSKTAPIKSSSPVKSPEKERDLTDEITRMKYRDSITSAQNSRMIQAFLRHSSGIQSSKSKPDVSPKCHTRAKTCDVSSDVMRSYETYRGLTSRDYAMKCLNLATSFSEKPWLHQVRQATAIAHQGVRKTLEGKPHLFMSEMEARNTRDKYGLSATPRVHNPILV